MENAVASVRAHIQEPLQQLSCNGVCMVGRVVSFRRLQRAEGGAGGPKTLPRFYVVVIGGSMTNEELATAIQQGHTELYPVLWERVRAFVIRESKRRYRAAGGHAGTVYEYTDCEGMTVADYAQSGYLAMVRAVKYCDPEKGTFLTLLGKCLTTEFDAATQRRGTRAREDPIHHHISLDAPLNADDPEGEALLDMQQAARDVIEESDERKFLEQLHDALNRAIAGLPAEQARTLTRRYWEGRSLREIGRAEGVSIEQIRQREKNGIKTLRRKNQELQQYIDQRTSFYRHVGVDEFQRTNTSAVERLTLERERLERILMEGIR